MQSLNQLVLTTPLYFRGKAQSGPDRISNLALPMVVEEAASEKQLLLIFT
ncbi:hypothetical protein [Pseudanabaena sp. FACHB-2040]|nr:hypothetical protein [Pseudanabaena sp. FACHB-2040]MBD2256942.1 hypothetical protein [Pseudanabaena sp. FACHB-2040]